MIKDRDIRVRDADGDGDTRLLLNRREVLAGLTSIGAAALLPGNVRAAAPRPGTAGPGRDRRFDDGWRFHGGDAEGAERPGFDDGSWRALDLPHDWSIEDLPPRAESTADSALWAKPEVPRRVGPFDAMASEGQTATGFVVGGTGWYRKRFASPLSGGATRAEVRFDGVYMDADVWLNGTHLGSHPYGYTGFAFDLTPALAAGENVLAVRVRNLGKNSRWYSGSGIYRHVWLAVTGDTRIATWGLAVATPSISERRATVRVTTSVENHAAADRSIAARVRLLDPDGNEAASGETNATVTAGGAADVAVDLALPQPRLWSDETPTLYTAEVTLTSDGKALDQAATAFGVRTIEVDAERGLRINGRPVELRGACLHHDNGALGAAAIDRAERRRVEIMKTNGFNAIRTSHNPPSPAFLDACDRLGVFVIDEAFDMWRAAKNPEDYHRFFDDWWRRDVEGMVVRDRNHPSVIFWSIGNEIHERAEPEGVEIAERLVGAIKRLDDSRPVTMAVCHFWDYKDRTWEQTDPAFTHLDVGGYNYKWQEYVRDHERHPDRVMCGTESFPLEAFENWQAVERHSWVIGDFVWTGMDYLGETGIGNVQLDRQVSYELQQYPWFNAYCGDIDLIGGKKAQSYFRDVVWRRSPVEMAVQRPVPDGHTETISMWGWSDELRSWTWPGSEGRPLVVRVYTRAETVRLLLDGKEVGTAPAGEANRLRAEFRVPYAPGELRAVAIAGGREIAATTLRTVGAPAALGAKADRASIRADRDDLAFVTIEVVDRSGALVPDAVVPVEFAIEGPAEIAAVASADPRDAASFRSPRRRTFQGRCLAIVRPTGGSGEVRLRAAAAGLAASTVTIHVG